MIERYYEEELRYLYESGREFAKAHPDRAQFLNIDSVGDRDPYVERLFEGFAFLAGRIREKLDDSFPQLTEGIINLLWPQLLMQIPALATVQFNPRKGALQQTRVLPRGSEVLSIPAGPESAVCRFITTQDVHISPLELMSVKRDVTQKSHETCSFRLQLEPSVLWKNCAFKSLRVYLHAEMPVALMLHEFLTTTVIKAQIIINDGQQVIDLDPENLVTPGGLTADTGLLPQDQRAFWGYNLLREYFVFPDKFLYVNLHGFDKIPATDPAPQTITYSITFSKQFPPDKPFADENFRLFCSPVVNCSQREIEPVNKTDLTSEYRLFADASHPVSTNTHSVISVAGIDRITGEHYQYSPLYSFKNAFYQEKRSFATRTIRTAGGKKELMLILGGATEDKELTTQENLSILAWCANGEIPRDHIKEGDIKNPGRDFPDFAQINNITRPTLPFSPPDDSQFHWMFQAHLSSTWASLASADTLKSFLKMYDWSGHEGRARRITAISEVQSEPAEAVISGCPVRGVRVTVTLRESDFKDSGDIHLFGLVLNEFLCQFVSINSFIELVFKLKPSDATMQWNSTRGKRCLI